MPGNTSIQTFLYDVNILRYLFLVSEAKDSAVSLLTTVPVVSNQLIFRYIADLANQLSCDLTLVSHMTACKKNHKTLDCKR